MKKPLVSVIMITYGHENFIEQAINGVLMQICDFDVELIIANDCSPDKTDDVIQNILENHQYPSWIRYTRHEKNIGMMPNFIFGLEQCKGKFIAICEGDDYWTDPLKLQKQVNFLNENLDFYGHAHQCNIIEDGKKNIIFKDKIKEILTVNDLIEGRLFHTATLMFRNEAKQIFNQIGHNVLSGDRLLFLSIAFKGKIYFSDEIMCIYRKHSGGISSTVRVDQILKDLYPISFLKKIYPNFPALRYKSYVYTTIALCNKATIFQKTYYLFMAFLTSFSYFPKNIVKFKKYFFR